MTASQMIQIAVAYSDSVNSIVGVVCLFAKAFFIYRYTLLLKKPS